VCAAAWSFATGQRGPAALPRPQGQLTPVLGWSNRDHSSANPSEQRSPGLWSEGNFLPAVNRFHPSEQPAVAVSVRATPEEIRCSTALPVPPRVPGRTCPRCTGGRGKPAELVPGAGLQCQGTWSHPARWQCC